VKKVADVILNATDNITTVNAYGKREQKTMQKLLDGIK
jgi:hypothetical protein